MYLILMLLAFQTPETKDLSSMLHKALEGAIILKSFPKTTVDVFALVLESGGSKYNVLIHFIRSDQRSKYYYL